MPLPAALLKRLSKRGILNTEGGNKPSNHHDNEEIIAEDYDEIEDPSQYDYEPVKKPQENFWIERMKRRLVESNHTGYKSCPNKYNIFHKCSLFCINRWGDGVLEPRRSYLRRRNRLLKKYPLPKNWMEVYDYGCGVYYYWNTTDDTVSWLPPSHPKSQISKSAASLRLELEEILPPAIEEDDGAELMSLDIQKILDAPLAPIPKRPASPPPELPPPPAFKKPKTRDLEKALRQKSSRKNRSSKVEPDPLDPMDPAAYSDIPRGKWSDGLNTENCKTAVDPTASGALYQMRPYPSPGAILSANADSGKSKSRNDSDDEGRT